MTRSDEPRCEDATRPGAGGHEATENLIETWIRYKREAEVDPARLRPHPWELALS
jgi:glutamine synthetase